MKVYVESNFVLEVALEQEQHEPCKELIRLAEEGAIELVMPSYALAEPHFSLVHNQRRREDLSRSLDIEAKQLQRTASLSEEVASLAGASELLIRAGVSARTRFSKTYSQLLNIGRFIPLTNDVLEQAPAMANRFDIELPDALMLASVLNDARSHPQEALFLNRNTKDFQQPDIESELEGVQCELLGSFTAGLARVQARLRAQASAPIQT